MSGEDNLSTGEYCTRLKENYKIPRKTVEDQEDQPTPPPPGTLEFLLQQNVNNSFEAANLVSADTNQPNVVESPADLLSARKRPSYSMLKQEGLPPELSKLILPLCCELCSTKSNSPVSAKMHYDSKNHEKKVNTWLLEWSIRTGEPMPKRQTIAKGPVGINALHCDVCDLALTSLQHANQHYMGKKHRQVLNGRSKPSGPGHFDANNKWIRAGKIAVDPTNRFFIGESFLVKKDEDVPNAALSPPQKQTTPVYSSPPNTPAALSPLPSQLLASASPLPSQLLASASPLPKILPDLKTAMAILPIDAIPNDSTIIIPRAQKIHETNKYCEICDISVTSEVHMKHHLSGAKHAKKLRLLGFPPFTETIDTISQSIMTTNETSDRLAHKNICIKDSVGNEINIKNDFSVYRTPSGQYYCQICDITLANETLFSQHFSSKKHMRTAASKRK